TFVELAQATNSVFPSGLRAISVGWLAVGHVAATLPAVRSTTATPEAPHRLINRRLPSGCGRQAYGNVSLSNVMSRLLSGLSSGKMQAASPHGPAANSVLPALSTARPLTTNLSLRS